MIVLQNLSEVFQNDLAAPRDGVVSAYPAILKHTHSNHNSSGELGDGIPALEPLDKMDRTADEFSSVSPAGRDVCFTL